MSGRFSVEWIDHQREPQCPPNPDYPEGIDVDASLGAEATCTASLPYPAPRCGLYVVCCKLCGFSLGMTTAGRSDDPRSVKVPCKPMAGRA